MRRTQVEITRGHLRELRKRGVTFTGGRARVDGRFISSRSLVARVAAIVRKPAPKPTRRPAPPTPKPPKPTTRPAPAAAPAPAPTPLGFERGPAYVAERGRLRTILGREPTEGEISRAVALRPPPPPRAPATFDEALARAKARGVEDPELFKRIASRFGVALHSVYALFHGYMPKIGKAAAA